MNATKIVISTLIGAVVNFLAGWLIYGILLKDTMSKAMTPGASALNKPEPNLVGIFIAGLIYAFLLAYIFEQWANIRTFVSGALAGAMIGCLIALSMDIQFWSMLTMYNNSMYILVDVAAATLMSVLMGGTIGWFLGFNRKDE